MNPADPKCKSCAGYGTGGDGVGPCDWCFTTTEPVIDYKAKYEEAQAEIERIREMFQETRRRMCRAFGVEEGKSWSALESMPVEMHKARSRMRDTIDRAREER